MTYGYHGLLFVNGNNCFYEIKATLWNNPKESDYLVDYPRMLYQGYTKKEAVSKYRKDHGLQGKSLEIF